MNGPSSLVTRAHRIESSQVGLLSASFCLRRSVQVWRRMQVLTYIDRQREHDRQERKGQRNTRKVVTQRNLQLTRRVRQMLERGFESTDAPRWAATCPQDTVSPENAWSQHRHLAMFGSSHSCSRLTVRGVVQDRSSPRCQ